MNQVVFMYLIRPTLILGDFSLFMNQNHFLSSERRTTCNLKRQYSATVEKSTGVRCDQTGELKGFYSAKDYPEKIRRIKFHDEE